MPHDFTPGRKTPMFTRSSVPPGLLAAHETSVWAELVVVTGDVVFVDEESAARSLVRGGERVVITPSQRHHVEPGESAEFYVQFYTS